MPEKWTSTIKNDLIKSLVSALQKLEDENRELREQADNKPTSPAAETDDEQLKRDVAELNKLLFGDDEPEDRGDDGKGER